MLARARRQEALAALALPVVVALALGACGDGASSASTTAPRAHVSSSSTSAEPPTANAPVRTAPGPPATFPACKSTARLVCITPQDEGKMVTVAVGSRLVLDLRGPGRVWGAPQQSGAHLLAHLGSVRREGDALEVDYGAERPGTTTLTSSERPVCAHGRVCPLFIVLWQVHVHVSG